jgi:hypothetical protein
VRTLARAAARPRVYSSARSRHKLILSKSTVVADESKSNSTNAIQVSGLMVSSDGSKSESTSSATEADCISNSDHELTYTFAQLHTASTLAL